MTNNTQGRMVLLLIIGFPLTMILAATWLWYFVEKGNLDLIGALGTANQGSLVQPPRQIDEYDLHDASGQQVKLANVSNEEPVWTMVIPAWSGRCDQACEKTLYETRQIRVALGKYYNRVRRVYVSAADIGDTDLAVASLSDGRPAAGSFADYLEKEHQKIDVVLLAREDQQQLFSEFGVDGSTWYLMDPAGWVMMSYNSDIPYKDVISDLKFLLKNSGG